MKPLGLVESATFGTQAHLSDCSAKIFDIFFCYNLY
jgi:hypothetical protein